MTDHFPVVIIGAGPAGLTAAHDLAQQGIACLVLEKADKVGGIARTESYKGYHFDVGGHRFYTKLAEVQKLWEEMLGEEFRVVQRLSRIYYQGRFFQYPLDFFDALSKLGPLEGLRILLSYFWARLRPVPKEDNLEEWVTNRFGRRLYETFFKTYTEKVWGMPCNRIASEWAVQRIQGVSLAVAVLHALGRRGEAKSLIRQFHYPVRGPGMMWQQFERSVQAQGGQVWLKAEAIHLQREGDRIVSADICHDGTMRRVTADHFISSMPLPALINRITPSSDSILQAAGQLTHRAFILVGLIVNRAELFPDQWVYIHSPGLKVGRIQNFKNWSQDMVPDPRMTSLGMEYFCSEGDSLWSLPDAALIALAGSEMASLGFAEASAVVDGTVIRQPAAYPVYDGTYRQALERIRPFLATITNLQTIGRNGMHRYNNQDHSMLTGMLAVRNLLGESHDLWAVNTERSNYEEPMTQRTVE